MLLGDKEGVALSMVAGSEKFIRIQIDDDEVMQASLGLKRLGIGHPSG